MSDKGYGLAGGSAFTLVTFVPEDNFELAENIIKQNGGQT
jgi:hypothetical protein